MTGASARDFANQAQGLGGLVRLYATYAANLFAATAAFNALSEAVNTSNMTRGLEQLGAAGGRNLTGLSKQFVEVTGYAISTREAIEATAKASSSGLSAEQFLKLGDVARQASQALGVGMTDAVSRLTRGITKLEPELLDELGIFTKVGTATEAYARSIGRSVTSLTDFERRQAFANAVLAEGAQKFGEIKLDTNPYDKFLATLKNVGFEILNVVNSALTPLISLLSNSPTALLAGIGLLANKIVKQALPALTDYRNQLRETTQQTAILAAEKAKEASAAFTKFKSQEKARELAKLEINPEAAEDYLEGLEQQALSTRYVNKEIKSLIKSKESSADWTETEIQKLEKLGKANTSVSKTYRDLALGIRVAQEEQAKYVAKRLEPISTQPGVFTRAAELQRQAQAARRESISSRTVQNINRTYDTAGFSAAVQRLTSIQGRLDNLGTATKWSTNIKAGSLIAARGIGTLASGIMSFVSGPLQVLLVALPVLDLLFSKNGEQLAKFNSTVDQAKSSTAAANATYEKFGNTLSVEASIARATAIGEVAKSITDLGKALRDADEKASWWDRLVDSFKKPIGLDLASKYTKELSGQVDALLKSISDPKRRKEIEAQLSTLMGGGSAADAQSREAYIGFMDPEALKRFGQGVENVAETINKEMEKTLAPLNAVKEGFGAIETKFKSLENSLVQKSALGDYGLEIIKQSDNIKVAIQDTYNMFGMLNDIAKDTSKVKFFDLSTQQSLLAASKQAGQLRIELEDAISAGNKVREGDIRKQINAVKLNVEKALKDSVVTGFKLLQSEAQKVVQQASIASSKSIIGLLPKTEESIKAQLSLDLLAIELKKAELLQTRVLIDTIARNSLTVERDTLQARKESLEKKVVSENLKGRSLDAALEEIQKIDSGLRSIGQEFQLLDNPSATRSKAEEEDITPAVAERRRQRAGLDAQLKALDLQGRTAQVTAKTEISGLGAETISKQLSQQKSLIELDQNRIRGTKEYLELSAREKEEKEEQFRREIQSLSIAIAGQEKYKEVVKARTVLDNARNGDQKEVSSAEAALALATREYEIAISSGVQAELNRQTIQAGALEKSKALEVNNRAQDLLNEKLEAEAKLNGLLRSQASEMESLEREQLTKMLELGTISQDFYDEQIRGLDKVALGKERLIKLEELTNTYTRERSKLESDIINATINADFNEEAKLRTKLINLQTYYNQEVAGVEKVYQAKTKLKGLEVVMTERQKNFADVMEKTFEGMADALTEFAKTGKLDFKGLIDSMLTDLLRYEMRLQYSNLFKSMNGGSGGILGFLTNVATNMFGGSVGSSGTAGQGLISNGMSQSQMLAAQTAGFAKGGAFDSGVEKFAKGGTFTNSVVSSPTLFKFAKGTGLMGEAGPEAIMPLKRDSSGNLGVRAQAPQSNVNVTVINNSSEKAETKETTDSRGNRSIEVVIGEMVAGEMARPNSSLQNTMKNTYGNAPVLIRR
jgi:lambda family phage tail tape measure protein